MVEISQVKYVLGNDFVAIFASPTRLTKTDKINTLLNVQKKVSICQ